MIYKLLFLHGFFNSGQCEMAKALQECLTDDLRSYDDMYAEDEVEVICPDLPKNPYEALDEIREIVDSKGIDVIVGNSCGAMYAHIIAAEHKLPCLVSNPYYKMSEFLKERIGTHEYKTERKDGYQTLVIDDDLVNSFIKLEKEDLVFKDADKCKQFVWGIFGENDTLANGGEDGMEKNKHEKIFLSTYSLSFHFPGKHTPTYDETRKYHVPLASRLIMEFAYYKKKQHEGETHEDKKYRLSVEYTHEFSQFYIDKMKELFGAKDFYRCDIEGDFSHIIYRYRPEGKDKPFIKDGVMYDFLIEYHRGKPSEGIYYGCKAEIVEGNMEKHAEALRNLWPNIFHGGYEKCNRLQRELTEILNNTFQWKNFFKCYKPTDNIWEQRYWLFWVTLCDDEDINNVGAVATKLMSRAFMREFNKEAHVKEPKSKGRGRNSLRVDQRKSAKTRQYTYYTENAYHRLVDRLGEGLNSTKQTFFFYDKKAVDALMAELEEYGVIKKNDKYEKGWTLNGKSKNAFVKFIKNLLTYKKKEKYKDEYKKEGKYSYPEEFDSIIMNEDETPINKQHG